MDIILIFHVMLMAIVQGIAEFLPISSSGHLIVLGHFFNLEDVFLLSILLHAGTLLSVLVFFYRELVDACVYRPRIIGLVIWGTIPTVVLAFTVQKFLPWIETSLWVTGCGFLATAFLLMTVMRRNSRTFDEEYYEKIAYEEEGLEAPVAKTGETTSWLDAFIVGLVQGIAVIPGLSRSGSTISAGVMRRFSNEWAAEFSFFLSIPVIAGGAALEIIKEVKEVGLENISTLFSVTSAFPIYLGGAFVSFIVGWISLYYLMQMLKAGKLHYFAVWLIFAGLFTLGLCAYENWDQLLQFMTQSSSSAQGPGGV